MKLRELKNMPLFYPERAEIIGKVERGVLGDDFQLLYLVVEKSDGTQGMIERADFDLGQDAVIIYEPDRIKSYAHGEELSVYQKKVGDLVFSRDGQELGFLSDFVLARENGRIRAVEVSAGALTDLLEGRRELPLEQVCWSSRTSLLVDELGGDQE